MKSLRIFRFVMVSLLALTVAQDGFARDVRSKITTESAALASEGAANVEISVDQQKELATTFAETELIVKNATAAIEKAQSLLLGANNEDTKNTAIIIEQTKAKVMAEQNLVQLRDDIFNQVTEKVMPTSYFSRFVTGVKNVGSTIASYFAPGRGTPEQKETAKLIVKGLTDQQIKITTKYIGMLKGLTPTEELQLKNRYEAIIAQFEQAFYEQQLITGDTKSGMNIKRSLLLGAAAAGTVAASVLIKNKYFGKELTGQEGSLIAAPKRITQQERDKNMAQVEKLMRDHAKQESTPYKVGSWLKQAPSKASDAARNIGQGVREGFERGADSKDYMEKTYGPSSTQFIKEKAEAGKQFATQKLAEGKDFAAQKRAEWAQKKAEGLAAEQAEIIERESIGQED